MWKQNSLFKVTPEIGHRPPFLLNIQKHSVSNFLTIPKASDILKCPTIQLQFFRLRAAAAILPTSTLAKIKVAISGWGELFRRKPTQSLYSQTRDHKCCTSQRLVDARCVRPQKKIASWPRARARPTWLRGSVHPTSSWLPSLSPCTSSPGWPPQPHTQLTLSGRAAEHKVAWAGGRLKLAAWLATSSAVHTTQAAFPRGLEQ